MRASRFASLVSFLMLCLASPVAARGGMPSPLTERGAIIEDIYYKIFVVAVIVFLFVMALLVYVMIRFRASSGHGKATFEHERENLKLEMTWIVIPLFIMLWIGYISYVGLIQLDEGHAVEDADMEIDIIGQKWFWTAGYQDFAVDALYDSHGVVNEGAEFYVPADQRIHLNVTGADVIHSFYIMDANQAPVGMVDANPTGPHKFNSMVIRFPEGEYHVQCKEMCFNPGHGYMRAKIISVPQTDFDAWYEETLTERNAPKLSFAIEIEDSGITTDGALKTAPDAAARLQFANNGTSDLTFTRSDGGDDITVPAGDLVVVDVLPEETGTITFSSDAGDVALEVVDPTIVDVELGDFYISPSSFMLEADTLYRIRLDNVGASPHNLFIGDYDGPSSKSTLLDSPTINGGDEGDFLVLVSQSMTFDTWCDIPGHAPSGMVGTVTVA